MQSGRGDYKREIRNLQLVGLFLCGALADSYVDVHDTSAWHFTRKSHPRRERNSTVSTVSTVSSFSVRDVYSTMLAVRH
eukprot:544975-Pleurochrysis_carterae.AAC.1